MIQEGIDVPFVELIELKGQVSLTKRVLKWGILLTILKLIFVIVVVVISSYCLITAVYGFFPNALIFIFLGMMFLVSGYEEFQKNRKGLGVFLFVVAAFQFIVVIKTLLN